MEDKKKLTEEELLNITGGNAKDVTDIDKACMKNEIEVCENDPKCAVKRLNNVNVVCVGKR